MLVGETKDPNTHEPAVEEWVTLGPDGMKRCLDEACT